MPSKKISKKSTKSRRPRRPRKKMSGARSLVNNALQPFPQNFICKMKYAADVQTTAGGQYNFNLNSIFDPDRSGGGHKVYGYNNLLPIYHRYRVISCGWRITSTSGSSATVQLGAFASNQGIALLNFAELKEQPRTKYVVQLPGASAAVLSGKINIPSLVGRTTAQYMADDRYQALMTADPAELAVLQVYTANGSGTFGANIINVILEYTVEFFDINNVAQST